MYPHPHPTLSLVKIILLFTLFNPTKQLFILIIMLAVLNGQSRHFPVEDHKWLEWMPWPFKQMQMFCELMPQSVRTGRDFN